MYQSAQVLRMSLRRSSPELAVHDISLVLRHDNSRATRQLVTQETTRRITTGIVLADSTSE